MDVVLLIMLLPLSWYVGLRMGKAHTRRMFSAAVHSAMAKHRKER